jgi:hypothetical protein
LPRARRVLRAKRDPASHQIRVPHVRTFGHGNRAERTKLICHPERSRRTCFSYAQSAQTNLKRSSFGAKRRIPSDSIPPNRSYPPPPTLCHSEPKARNLHLPRARRVVRAKRDSASHQIRVPHVRIFGHGNRAERINHPSAICEAPSRPDVAYCPCKVSRVEKATAFCCNSEPQ